jgi:hypothetical protein
VSFLGGGSKYFLAAVKKSVGLFSRFEYKKMMRLYCTRFKNGKGATRRAASLTPAVARADVADTAFAIAGAIIALLSRIVSASDGEEVKNSGRR